MIPEASVIIPTYDDWHDLQKCLDCLTGQSIGPHRFEVIVANNNASPEVPAALRLAPNTRVIHVPKPGSYAARNAALRQARGDVLFFTDSDCQPDRHWIENGMAALSRLRPIDRVAGAIELFPKGEIWTGPELYDSFRYLKQATYARDGWCATANLATRRAAFDLVGPFSEDAFSGGDHEWGSRAAALGSLIILSRSTLIRHPAREDFAVLAKKARRIAGNIHHRQVMNRLKARWTISYLLPRGRDLGEIARDPRFSDTEKLKLMSVEYRWRVVFFVELVRLRYLSGTPKRG